MAKTTKKTATKSVKPSGLTIARNGYTFACTWKIGDKDYGDGQQFEFKFGSGAWQHNGSSSAIGKTATSASFSINPANFYPTAGKGTLGSVTFRVRGNRKKYTEKKKTKNPTWSDWVEKSFVIRAPYAPSNSGALDSEADNKTTFSGSGTSNSDDAYMFTRLEWQTALTTDSASPNYGGVNVVNSTSWSTVQTEDTSVINNGHSHTRYVRVRAVGVGGASAWVVTKHVYAVPNKPTNLKTSCSLRTTAVDVIAYFNTRSTGIQPIDSIKTQYCLTTPGAGLVVPSGASWTDRGSTAYKDGSDTIRFSTDSPLTTDQVLFVRAATIHDRNEVACEPIIGAYGALATPTGVQVTMGTSNTIVVQATNASSVPGSFLAVLYQNKAKDKNPYVAGIIPNGDDDVNITVAPWGDSTTGISVGVYAAVGTYSASTRGDGSTAYTISPYNGKRVMTSTTVWPVIIPVPASVAVTEGSRDGVARVSWSWNSSIVDGVEITWADHDDAWQSTDEPEEYQVSIINSPVWNISSLETGRTWYFKLRFYMTEDNVTQYSPYSEIVALDLTSAPEAPSLVLSNEAVIPGETFDASWAYVTTDGTRQAYAEICLVTENEGTLIYGDVIAKTTTSQRVTIDPNALGWTAGQTKLLAMRVVSLSGRSSEWSGYEPIHIVEPVTCEITSASLVEETVDERTYMALKEMPMTVTVTGAGNTKTTSLVIERADSYHLDRPDEGEYEGYKGEAVYVYSQTGDAQIIVNLDALIGRLDDGAPYRLVATVSDQYGQKATATQDFEVHWTHQALMPYVVTNLNEDYNVAMITPLEPSGTLATDSCDIYRLSIDKPVLIYKGAVFGETYVDPYPTMGEESGGYRVVFRTANNDYITEGNQIAMTDASEYLDIKGTLIDFDEAQIHLTRNVDLSHDWGKDFTETQYLGGSVQGDWNPAVHRNGSVSSVAITLLDMDEIRQMRRLATYPGLCHIRTYDGSNFDCNIDVSESRSHDKGGYVVNYTMKITRVDPQGYDGMTLKEWLSGLDAEYIYTIANTGHLIEESELPSGYTFTVDANGHLIMTVGESAVQSISFALNNGELEVTIE